MSDISTIQLPKVYYRFVNNPLAGGEDYHSCEAILRVSKMAGTVLDDNSVVCFLFHSQRFIEHIQVLSLILCVCVAATDF
ncbi:hypothetical protein FCM35_KLT02431 [Carex littledalei]|uniref:Uncharacterized protein n=1 Tax=Carex littledalei TaxID=544730 RepID=A0A833RBX3_9POAL|nr:hypothetical protein FCM35_KLT02431 [Carex littledalei]